jgi:hypothetical protein
MNQVCADDVVGKCVCYKDAFNYKSEYSTLNGVKYRKGLDLFEAAKKSCVEIVDKCMDVRRAVTSKYENGVQRDCLLLAGLQAELAQGALGADYQNLRSCMRPWCTAYAGDGMEDFKFPEMGICFVPEVANFIMDAKCGKVLAEAEAQLAVRDVMSAELAALREQSCKRMNGRMSDDRRYCYLAVKYGNTKKHIRAEKEVMVGKVLECTHTFFGVSAERTYEAKRQDRHQRLQTAASITRITTGVVGSAAMIVGTAGLGVAGAGATAAAISLGGAVATAADTVASTAGNMYYDGRLVEQGYMSKEEFKAGNNAWVIAGQGIATAASVALSAIGLGSAGSAATAMWNAANIVSLVSTSTAAALEASAVIVDKKMQEEINEYRLGLEEQGIIAHSKIGGELSDGKDNHRMANRLGASYQEKTANNSQGATIVGAVEETDTVRGSCFINGEWFASEGEFIFLQWTL